MQAKLVYYHFLKISASIFAKQLTTITKNSLENL